VQMLGMSKMGLGPKAVRSVGARFEWIAERAKLLCKAEEDVRPEGSSFLRSGIDFPDSLAYRPQIQKAMVDVALSMPPKLEKRPRIHRYARISLNHTSSDMMGSGTVSLSPGSACRVLNKLSTAG